MYWRAGHLTNSGRSLQALHTTLPPFFVLNCVVLTTPNSNLKGQRILQHLCDPLQSAYRTRLCPFHWVGQFFFHFLPSLRTSLPSFSSCLSGILNTFKPSIPSGKCSTTSASTPAHISSVTFLCFFFVWKGDSSKSSSLSVLLSPAAYSKFTLLSSSSLLSLSWSFSMLLSPLLSLISNVLLRLKKKDEHDYVMFATNFRKQNTIIQGLSELSLLL